MRKPMGLSTAKGPGVLSPRVRKSYKKVTPVQEGVRSLGLR